MQAFVKLSPIPDSPNKFLTAHHHPLYGKQIYRIFSSIGEALKYKAEIERGLSTDLAPEKMNIEQLLLLFKEERPKALTFKYRNRLLLDFLETFASFAPKELTEPVFESWLQRYAKERNFKDATINGERGFLSYFFTFLKEKRVIFRSPVIQRGGPQKKPLSKEEIRIILSECKRLSPGHLYPMALLSAEAKIMRNEIFSLRWKQVDLKRGTIHFPRVDHVVIHKMSNELLTVISSVPRKSLLVFLSQSGKPLSQLCVLQTRGRFKNLTTYRGRWSLDDLRQYEEDQPEPSDYL